jgi:hypothetical protein
MSISYPHSDLLNSTFKNTPLPTYDFKYAKVIKVYDGDTFWIAAENDNKIIKYPVRLYGCDCSEIKGGSEESKLKAQKAKEFVVNVLLDKIVKIEILNGKKYEGKIIKEKYGRLIAKVSYFDNEWRDLTEALISQNLAYAYHGGTKQTS